MFKLLLKVFGVLFFMMMGMGIACAQMAFGIKVNKALEMPKCEVAGAHFPQEVCYWPLSEEETAFGPVKRVSVYFPEHSKAVDLVSNEVQVVLFREKVVEVHAFTAGLSTQQVILDKISAEAGPAEAYRVVADDKDAELNQGAMFAQWSFEARLVIRFFGSLRSSASGGGMVSTVTPTFERLKAMLEE